MKKVISLIMIVICALSIFVGCGSSNEEVESNNSADHSATADPQKQLKNANSNALTVYKSIFDGISDLVEKGEMTKIPTGKFGSIRITDLDTTEYFQNIVKKNLGEKGLYDEGFITWEIDTNTFKPVFAQWSESTSSPIVGQYPDPETDPNAQHSIGAKF